MKKILVMFLALAMALSLAACGSEVTRGGIELDDSLTDEISEVAEKAADAISNVAEEVMGTLASSAEETEDLSMSAGQRNALESAKDYLDFMAFSYSGIIEQLEFEGYTHDEAIFAADNCGADWKEQAVKSAESYLEFSSFSRQGLKEQLEFEGFTAEEAEYGVSIAYN